MAFIFPSSEYLYLVITIACFCWRAKICYQPMCTTMQTTMLKYLCGKTERVDKYQLLLGVCLWFNIKKKVFNKKPSSVHDLHRSGARGQWSVHDVKMCPWKSSWHDFECWLITCNNEIGIAIVKNGVIHGWSKHI